VRRRTASTSRRTTSSLPRDTVSLLREVAAKHPDAEAFVEANGRRLSYGAWDRAADGIAAGLAANRATAGDVVALLLPSSLDYMVCYQAAMRLGAITTGINQRLGPEEVDHILARATPVITVVSDDDARRLPPTCGTLIRWSELAAWWDAPAPPLPRLQSIQPVIICWTGGTTGRPKGVVFDHDNLAGVAAATGVLSAPFDRRLSPIPFAHVGTMTRAWDEISRVITTVITPTPWQAAATLALIERERVTVAQGVPTQWELMLREPALTTTDLSSLRLAGIGGSAVSGDLLDRMRAALGVPVVNRYAATEAGGVIAGTRPEDPDEIVLSTVGRAAEGVELRAVDDDGRPVSAGEVGQVQVRSRAVMRGYWREPDETARVLDAGGWVTVGDVGRLDANGNLTLVGRDGDRYVRGGYNVYPAEIERVLAAHEWVAEVAVLGTPDPVLGEVGVAFVVAAEPIDVDELRRWVGQHLADYKIPDRVVVLEAMPLTAIGKIDRRALTAVAAVPPNYRQH
jgi:acyl-CoA synthetase (AMP-forming)/AMP-acid ligase II